MAKSLVMEYCLNTLSPEIEKNSINCQDSFILGYNAGHFGVVNFVKVSSQFKVVSTYSINNEKDAENYTNTR